jgi:Flp pilus assembly protein TadG
MNLFHKFRDESGSAVVEFVALALPLFVPVIIFLSQFATLSNDEFIVRSLARESVRAYILSANDLSATINARNTMKTGARELGLKEERIKDLDFTVDCAGLFCITPDNKVEITITLRSQDGKRVSTATARETVSPWV